MKMGYDTKFRGEFKFDRPLTAEHGNQLRDAIEDDARPEGISAEPPDGFNQWSLGRDNQTVRWDHGEKFGNYVEHLRYVVAVSEHLGYVLNGEVLWAGEEVGDNGKIVVRDNVVRVFKARIVYDVEAPRGGR